MVFTAGSGSAWDAAAPAEEMQGGGEGGNRGNIGGG